VRAFLAERKRACVEAGIRPEHLVVDPGFGFDEVALGSPDHAQAVVGERGELGATKAVAELA
jgi:dihydropteroate synthase